MTGAQWQPGVRGVVWVRMDPPRQNSVTHLSCAETVAHTHTHTRTHTVVLVHAGKHVKRHAQTKRHHVRANIQTEYRTINFKRILEMSLERSAPEFT